MKLIGKNSSILYVLLQSLVLYFVGLIFFMDIIWQVYLKLQAHASARNGSPAKNSSAFLKAATTTLLHTISESEKASYVAHINNYLAEDEFLKRYIPINPTTNDLFEIAKDGVLLW